MVWISETKPDRTGTLKRFWEPSPAPPPTPIDLDLYSVNGTAPAACIDIGFNHQALSIGPHKSPRQRQTRGPHHTILHEHNRHVPRGAAWQIAAKYGRSAQPGWNHAFSVVGKHNFATLWCNGFNAMSLLLPLDLKGSEA